MKGKKYLEALEFKTKFKIGDVIAHPYWSFTMKIIAFGDYRFLYKRTDGRECVATMSSKFYHIQDY